MTGGRGQHASTRPWPRARRLLAVAGALVVLVAAGVIVWQSTGSAGSGAPAPTKPRRTTSHPTAPTTSLGPAGVRSSAIVAENRRPGTTAWQISGTPPSGTIDGFADHNYAAVGDQVGLYVSTTAPRFRVVAYRMGWYEGKGARQIWSSPEVAGTVQPPCPVTPQVNMVSCDNWSKSLTMPITAAFVQGDYLLKLIGSGNEQAYVPLTVWDPSSTAAYLVMARSLTEEGWNTYGGYSYYQGQGPCTLGQSGSYPPCNRARIVSFDRPYASGNGATDFLSNEYPLVRYMERNGLDVAYCTDVTVTEHPGMLLHHRALLSLGHDETWTYAERQGAKAALAHGVNIAFLGAAAVLRHSRLQASPLGPDREEVDYRNSTEDPLDGKGNPMEVTGNTWSSPPTSWSGTPFVGELYSGYLEPGTGAVPFVVFDASAWIFKGTGLTNGSSIPGVVDSDIDHLDPGVSPPNIQVLGHSPVPLSKAYTNQGKWGSNTYSDMTYYTDPASQGGVFDTGTVNWIYELRPCGPSAPSCPASMVGKITGNLLWLFGQGPAGTIVAPQPNAASVTPPGS